MKTQVMLGLLLMACLLVTQQSHAQLVAEGTYDLQFANPTFDGSEYCITLQIRSAVAGESFAIGSYTAFFNYNTAAINNPSYSQINFGDANLCAFGGGTSPYLPPAFGFDAGTGEASVTTIIQIPNQGCPEITDSWIDVGEICFDIIDAGQSVGLTWNGGLTEFNKNDNTPNHDQGALFGFTETPNSASGACFISIDNLTVTNCSFSTNTYSLEVAVTYSDIPSTTLNINGTDFSVDGSGLETFTLFGLPIDGSMGNTVTAFFDGTCLDVATYDITAACTGGCDDGGTGIMAIDDIVVTEVNESVVVEVLDNDTPPMAETITGIDILSPPANGDIEWTATNITYAPNLGFSGIDQLTYAIYDDLGNCSFANVQITVIFICNEDIDAGNPLYPSLTVEEGGSTSPIVPSLPTDASFPTAGTIGYAYLLVDPSLTMTDPANPTPDGQVVAASADGSFDFTGMAIGTELCIYGLVYDNDVLQNFLSANAGTLGLIGITPGNTMDEVIVAILIEPLGFLPPTDAPGLLSMFNTFCSGMTGVPISCPDGPLCIDITDTKTCITVIDSGVPNLSVSNSSPVCEGEDVTLFANTTTPGFVITYLWAGPGAFTSTDQNPVLSAVDISSAGSYTCVVTVDGVMSNPAVTVVEINPIPFIGSAGGGLACEGDHVGMFVELFMPGATIEYAWYSPSGVFLSPLAELYVFAVDAGDIGTYTCYVTVDGCEADPVNIFLDVAPLPEISVADFGVFCEGSTAEFTATSADGLFFEWTVNGDIVSSDAVVTINNVTVDMDGSDYTVFTTDANGCVNSESVQLQVVTDIGLTVSNDGPYCTGQDIELFAETDLPVAGTTYLWTGPGGFTSTEAEPVIVMGTDANSGVYTCQATSGSCISSVETTTVVVNNAVPPTATIISNDASICIGDDYDIEVELTGTAPWSLGWLEGADGSIASSPFTFPAVDYTTQTYELWYVFDENCQGTVSPNEVTITVDEFEIANIIETCDAGGATYTVSFDIIEGTPPFTVNGAPIVGNTFTSALIPTGNPYSFSVADAGVCEDIEITGTFNCVCFSYSGTMDATLIELCEGEPAIPIHNGDEILDGNDALTYVLHTNPGSTLGILFDINSTGLFDFDLATMSYGTSYFISVAVGNDNGSGSVDFTDPCLSIAPGTPVTWYQNPVAEAGNDAIVCGLAYTLNALVSFGTGMWEASPAAAVIDDPTNPTTEVSVPIYGTYVFTWTETVGTDCSSSSQVFVTFDEGTPADAGPDDFTCGASYQLNANQPIGSFGYWLETPAYSFDNPNSPNATVTVPFVGGNYDLIWTLQDGDCVTQDVVNITFVEEVFVDAGPDVFILLGEAVQLNALITGFIGTTAAWSPPIGISDPSVVNPFVAPMVTTTYTITVTDPNGCTDTDAITVFVDDTPCSIDCVWPGDANADGIANNFDLLNVGLTFGFTGDARFQQDTDWYAHYANAWAGAFDDGTNHKYADCDGNGEVQNDDLLAINLNYGMTHGKNEGEAASETASPLFIEIPLMEYTENQAVTLPLILGDMDNPLDEIYGLAFTLEYDATLIVENSVNITFTDSWLGNTTNTLNLQKDFFGNGQLEAAICRTDHINTTGYGQIATINFVIIENIDGKTDGIPELYLNITNVRAIAYDETELDVQGIESMLPLVVGIGTPNNPNASEWAVQLYPNPVFEKLWIQSDEPIQTTEVYNALGQLVFIKENQPSEIGNTELTITVENWQSGFYFVRLASEKGIMNRKIFVW